MIRSFSIYWIQDEVAAYFYGRERLFFTLFNDYQQAEGVLKQMLKQQIEYITKPLPYLLTHRLIQQCLLQKKLLQNKNQYLIHYPEYNSSACLEIYDRCFHIHAEGMYDAEAVFFEILKKFEGKLLAIDLENEQFGWIKPIKERKFVY
ncbi:sporulation inhibitor of replication protein SirA [Bacillus spongiae]|uniref:Sporulation inhibitor of replication protein SirA n=1 Tax=Bacillus spongiae TaxID=2683610 RepID=A0ABU8HC30_9BACI